VNKGHHSEQGRRQQIKDNIANKGHHGKQGYTTGLELDFSLDKRLVFNHVNM